MHHTDRWMEHIDGINGSLASLFVAEDEVDPLMQMLCDVARLQHLSVDQHEEACVVLAPARQLHMVHTLAYLANAKVKTCYHKEIFSHHENISTWFLFSNKTLLKFIYQIYIIGKMSLCKHR